MISELSVIWISLSVIVLCWAVVRMNQKIDEAVAKNKRPNGLEEVIETGDTQVGQQIRASYPEE